MSTLAQLGDRARRKLGLALGSHTITLTYASIADQDTVSVHGVVLTCFTGAALTEKAQFKKETDGPATATNLADLITAIFDTTTGVSASAASGVVTITGASSVQTDNATGFAISESSASDEEPYTADIDQWILDGQLDVANKLVNEALKSGESNLSEVFPIAGDGAATAFSLAAVNHLRIEAVTAKMVNDSKLYRVEYLKPDMFLTVNEDREGIYGLGTADGDQQYYTLYDEQIHLTAAPANAAAMIEIIGIEQPQTTKGVACDLPVAFQPLVEDYAVIQGLGYLGRDDRLGIHFQKYTADIQAINANYNPELSHDSKFRGQEGEEGEQTSIT